MATAACLPIAADRAGPCVRTIFFEGLDLTGVTLGLEMRLNPETPGLPAVALGMGATANAEGLRLVGVTVANGVPTSQVVMRVNETTMKDAAKVPYIGELGSSSMLYYDLIGIFGQDKRRLIYGAFTALPTVYGMNGAPAARAVSYGPASDAGTTWTSARLVFSDDDVTVRIDGADLLGGQVEKATQAAASASEDADRAEAAGTIAQFYSLPVFDTKALATAAIGSIADGAKVGIEADESRGGARTIYRKMGGALVFVANLSQIIQPSAVTFYPAPADANGGNSQVLFRRPSPSGDGWGDVTSSISASVITDPLGTYADNVFALFGYNMTTSFGQRDTTKPTTSVRCEERYRGANVDYKPATEYHFTTTPAGSMTEIRWFSAYGTHLLADWNASGWSWQFANFTWFTPFGNEVIEQWTPNGGDAAANGFLKGVTKKSITLFSINGYAHTIQATADGSGTISLPFINGRNEEQHAAPQFIGAAPVANIFGQRALATTLIDNPVDGDSILYGRMSGDAVAGTLYSRQHYGDADEFSDRMFNGKTGGRVVHHLYALSGDSFTRYEAPSRTVSAGVRYADSRYVVARGSDLGDELIGIDRATGRATFAGSVSKAAYTVAALPNPTSVPAGTEAYCVNESGGGVPVFSDGTNWRRMTDRAVVS